MSTGDLLSIQPTELKFPFELKKQSSCSLQLTNKTDNYVAFKVKTTNPKKYCVRPNAGIVLPGSTCDVTVTMQAQKEAPPDMQCKDKFLLQSVAAPDGSTTKDITPEMFNKEDGKVVEEFKLRVIYFPANPPSPVPEGSDEGSSPRAVAENATQNSSLFDAVSRSLEEPKEKSSEAWSMISKLTEEKTAALQQNQKLRQELELVRKEISKSSGGGYSLVFVVLFGLLGILVGFFIKKT
ncbi:vesicle-associated protein 1-3-like [Argentina anserina]|uniref:vesicle-associated protein 1-3-like n=1 Tax=Argentina anserina TaxID=57926 RepID=UPI0021768BAA|nr:vesicle-associated protein 1-3-like [Potentilla anserina]